MFDVSYSWSIIIGLVFVVLASLVAWFFSPKGENNTYVPFRLEDISPFAPDYYTMTCLAIVLFSAPLETT